MRCTAWFDDDKNTRRTGINTLFDFLLKTFILHIYLARCLNNWTQLMLIPQPESAKPANVHLIETSLTYLHHQLVVSCSVIFLIEFISEVWGSRFLWKQEKTYSVDYIHHLFCTCISIEFASINLLSNSKKCRNFATHSDQAISTKLDFETWHGDMDGEGELAGVNYNWLKRLPCNQELTLKLYKL